MVGMATPYPLARKRESIADRKSFAVILQVDRNRNWKADAQSEVFSPIRWKVAILRSKATSKRLTLGGANDKLNSLRPYSRATMPPFALRSWTLILLLATVANSRAQSPEDHWAWKRPAKPAVPAGVGNPIDAFVRLRLETEGLKVAPPATREHRIRRLTFDLTGLPPTPEEIAAFAKDQSPDAWEKVIDRLLASPRYGERWGRHWLDLARYADTNGYELDEVRPDAWRYRDYVISSFNDDKPFDRFAIEQLAGDEAFPGNTDAVIATGFNLLGPDMTDASDQAQRRLNTLNDMTDTASLAFLGMTVGCARCHDHKFEPIPQADYFRFQAFFAPATFRKDLPVASDKQVRAQSAAQREYQSLTQPIRDELAVVEGPHRNEFTQRSWLSSPQKRKRPTARPKRLARAASRNSSPRPSDWWA